jgi:hypothetical protein
MAKPDDKPVVVKAHEVLFHIPIHEILQRLAELDVALDKKFDRLLKQGEKLMALSASTQAKLEALAAGVDAIKTSVSDGVAGLAADIAALKAAVPDPTPEFDAALDALNTRVAGLKATADTLTALDAENPVVKPPVEEPPVEEPPVEGDQV